MEELQKQIEDTKDFIEEVVNLREITQRADRELSRNL